MRADQQEALEQERSQENDRPEDRAALAQAAWEAADAAQTREDQIADARKQVAAAVDNLPPLQPSELIERTSDNRVVLADDVAAVRLTPSYDGYLDVVMHGDPSGTQADVRGQRIDFSAEQTAQLIESTRSWDRRPVRLMSCSTGQHDYAQALADRLDVPVYAPSDVLSVYADGRTVVDNGGTWQRFEPARH